MDSSYVCAGSFIIIAFILLVFSLSLKESIGRNSKRDLRVSVLQILDPDGAVMSDVLQSRAAPNQRLRLAFGLTNTFVSPNLQVHTFFKRHASQLMRAAAFDARGAAARRLRDITTDAMQAYLPFSSLSPTPIKLDVPNMRFDILIQGVTLRAIVAYLLDVDVQALAWEDIHVVTSGINTLWNLSKVPGKQPSPSLLANVNMRLNSWVGAKCVFENPIDIIIPAYETMWRVVAISVAYAANDQDMGATFVSFAEHPTLERFADFGEGTHSPESVVLETLRLYPPTKRISREISVYHPFAKRFPDPLRSLLARTLPSVFAPRVETLRADVEAAQRDPSVWGYDAADFNPTRFKEPQQLRESMFAFGGGPVGCVAKRWAPMASAVMVASVLSTMETEGYAIRRGENIGGREGWDGWEVTPCAFNSVRQD
jgi:hypothetical protein